MKRGKKRKEKKNTRRREEYMYLFFLTLRGEVNRIFTAGKEDSFALLEIS